MENIRKRNREMEMNMSTEYIDSLNQFYNEYFYNYKATPVITIEADEIDFVNSEKDFKNILDLVRKQAEKL